MNLRVNRTSLSTWRHELVGRLGRRPLETCCHTKVAQATLNSVSELSWVIASRCHLLCISVARVWLGRHWRAIDLTLRDSWSSLRWGRQLGLAVLWVSLLVVSCSVVDRLRPRVGCCALARGLVTAVAGRAVPRSFGLTVGGHARLMILSILSIIEVEQALALFGRHPGLCSNPLPISGRLALDSLGEPALHVMRPFCRVALA